MSGVELEVENNQFYQMLPIIILKQESLQPKADHSAPVSGLQCSVTPFVASAVAAKH